MSGSSPHSNPRNILCMIALRNIQWCMLLTKTNQFPVRKQVVIEQHFLSIFQKSHHFVFSLYLMVQRGNLLANVMMSVNLSLVTPNVSYTFPNISFVLRLMFGNVWNTDVNVYANLYRKELVITGSEVTSWSPVSHQLCHVGIAQVHRHILPWFQ